MPRKYKSTKRYMRGDPHYDSKLISRFINGLMLAGKKSTAQGILYRAFDFISRKMTDADPVEVFKRALENVKPRLEVRPRRVGGATYQVPMEVRSERQVALAVKWIITAARSRKGKPMHVKLADELIAAYNREGVAFKKREDTHRMAEANKAFAHLAW